MLNVGDRRATKRRSDTRRSAPQRHRRIPHCCRSITSRSRIARGRLRPARRPRAASRSTSARGTIVGLLGPNGSGKTTLLAADRWHAAAVGRAASRSTARDVATLSAARPRAPHRRRAAGNALRVRLHRARHRADGPLRAPRARSSSRGRRPARSPARRWPPPDTPALETRLFDTLCGGEKQRVVIAGALAQAVRRAAARRADGLARSAAISSRSPRCSRRLNRDRGTTMVLSTHDLNLAAAVCSRARAAPGAVGCSRRADRTTR